MVYGKDLAISWLGPVRSEEDRKRARESLELCKLAVLLNVKIGVLRPREEDRGFVCRHVRVSPEVLNMFVYREPRDRDTVVKLSDWLEEVAG